jgi:hypothetical protein
VSALVHGGDQGKGKVVALFDNGIGQRYKLIVLYIKV